MDAMTAKRGALAALIHIGFSQLFRYKLIPEVFIRTLQGSFLF